MLRAKNGLIDGTDYVRFGDGPNALVMLPGLGDGLRTVRGMALPLAWSYRRLARDFTVYLFSRPRDLSGGCTTRDMAASLAASMDALGLSRAAVVGVSMGGMIAQWLAADHPDKVRRLMLVVTLARPNATMRETVGHWMDLARAGDYGALMADTAEHSYTEARLRKMRPLYGLLGRVGRPKDFGRFLVQANACLTHDAWDALPGIACPALALGGADDRIVTGEASREIAARIPNCALHLLQGLGHGLYEEAPDFLARVAAFCGG